MMTMTIVIGIVIIIISIIPYVFNNTDNKLIH